MVFVGFRWARGRVCVFGEGANIVFVIRRIIASIIARKQYFPRISPESQTVALDAMYSHVTTVFGSRIVFQARQPPARARGQFLLGGFGFRV